MNLSNCILIVDDSEDTRELFTATLAAEHFDVVACGNGQDALEVLSKRDDFALMLLDLSMPGMTGIQMLEQMKTQNLGMNVPVMLVSAFKDLGVMELPSNVIGTLKKPFFYPELLFKIRKILEPRTMMDGSQWPNPGAEIASTH